MVQFKASSLVLVAAIAGYAQTSFARQLDVRDFEEDGLSIREFQDRVIRAIVEEALLGRSFDLESSEITTRDFEDVEQRSPEPVVNFFKGVGQFVKRAFRAYWREMQDEVSFLDMRKRHPHPDTDFRARRHRMEGDQLESRSELEGFRPRRRRFSDDQLVRRHHQDYYCDRRRRFADGEMVRRNEETDYCSRRRRSANDGPVRRHHQYTYLDRRRRFAYGEMVRRNSFPSDDTSLAAREDQDLLPRMSWYGKALLIYRDMKHPASDIAARSEGSLDELD